MPAEGTLRDGTTADFELIETLRWQPDAGFVRLDRHLARLKTSAEALGFLHDDGEILTVLERTGAGEIALRTRLTLAHDGKTNVTTAPFQPLPENTVWSLRVARTRIASNDPLIRQKTTRRGVYELARGEFTREQADEVLLLNERDEVCEGTITNVFADFGDGFLKTPALSCGLLPGVLRGEMLDTGKAQEAVLEPDDLRRAKALFVGNSLRGLIPARLA